MGGRGQGHGDTRDGDVGMCSHGDMGDGDMGTWEGQTWGHEDALTWGRGDAVGQDTGAQTQGNRAWGHSGDQQGHGETLAKPRPTWQPWEGSGVSPAPVPPLTAAAASPARPSAPSTWRTWSGRSRDPSLSPAAPPAPGPRCLRTGCPDPGTPPHTHTDAWVPPGCGSRPDAWVPTPAVPQAGLLRRDGTGRRHCHLRGLPRRDIGLRQGAPTAAWRCGTRRRAAPLHPHRHQVRPGGGTGGLGDRVALGTGGGLCEEGVGVRRGEGAASPVGAAGWGGSSCKAPVQGCARPWCKGRARPREGVQSPSARVCKVLVHRCAKPWCKAT